MQLLSFCLRLLLCALMLVSVIAAQQPSSDPSREPRKIKKEPNDAHKKWLENDVGPIITAEERRAFLALQTDEERENFITTFWGRRDPSPDTEENEFREEYYERIAYANENFTSGIPGHRTDRGRIYIKWGRPDSVESRPSGGAYDRPSYEGGGSTTTYPFEIWFYRHLDGVGDGIEIEFVDRTGTGEYRIARSPDEKNALATVPGIGRIDTNDPTRVSFQREQDTPFRRNDILSALDRQPPVKFGDILAGIGQGESPVIDNNPLFFDVRIDMFKQSEVKVVALFTVQANNDQFKFEPVGGVETAKLNVIGRITSVAGKRTGIFEDSMTTTATTHELTTLKTRSSIYQKAVALPPGKYKVDIGLRDVSTGNKGITSLSFDIPRYDEKKLSTSTLIIASRLRPTDPQDIGTSFVIGSAKVIPNVLGRFKQGQDVGVYLQVYNSGIDQTTLRPSVDVDYVFVRNGDEVIRQKEDWSGLSESGQRLTLARLFPTNGLSPGDYELKVIVRDKVGGQVVENKGKITIEE